MIRLALLRHGHTAWNRAGRIQGRTDIPLDPAAEVELSTLRLPAPWDAARLVSSPLLRAQRTAELIAGRSAKLIPELLEMNWGAWEGAMGMALRADATSGFRDIEDWGWDFRPPDGESPSDLRNRLAPWANGLTSDTVAVCHIGIMRVLLALATGWNFADTCPFTIKRNRLYIIEISKGQWRMVPEPLRLIQRSEGADP
ncbi:MAG: histidine phosphatase family protein [Pseudomonadota bacterium]